MTGALNLKIILVIDEALFTIANKKNDRIGK